MTFEPWADFITWGYTLHILLVRGVSFLNTTNPCQYSLWWHLPAFVREQVQCGTIVNITKKKTRLFVWKAHRSAWSNFREWKCASIFRSATPKLVENLRRKKKRQHERESEKGKNQQISLTNSTGALEACFLGRKPYEKDSARNISLSRKLPISLALLMCQTA